MARVTTGHTENIFSAQFVPGTDDRKIVSAAADGQIRLHDLESPGTPRLLHTASNFVLKMDFHPQLPSVFLATGYDGIVVLVDLRM